VAICISMTALTSSWPSLEVMKHFEGDRLGLLGGVVGCAAVKGIWIISVGAIANVGMIGTVMYVLGKIYTE